MSIRSMLLVAALSTGLTGAGHAADSSDAAPTADWSTVGTQHYQLRTTMAVPVSVLFDLPEIGYDYIGVVDLWMLTTCGVDKVRAQSTRLRCTLDDVAVAGVPFAHREDELLYITQYIDDELTGSAVELNLNADGRLTSLDLVGPSQDTVQDAFNLTILRSLTRVAFSGFDNPLPKSWTEDHWVGRGSELIDYPGVDSKISQGRVGYRLASVDEDTVEVAAEGDLSMQIALMRVSRGPDRNEQALVGPTFSGEVSATATLDRATGTLLARTWTLSADLTVAHASEGNGSPLTIQGAILRLDDPSQSAPHPPSGLLTASL